LETCNHRVVQRYLNSRVASISEKEVERLLKRVLPGTPFAGKAMAVGGYIRDEYIGLEAKDLDIVVDMRGGAKKITTYLHNMFSREITRPHHMGAQYPIWQITFKDNIEYKGQTYRTKGAVIEFADTMKEKFTDPTSRQRKVMPATLEEDVERRDFTVNMLLKDLTSGEVVDLTGTSKHDIEKGILRGHPRVSLDKILNDDPLRMIRLVRFQCKYNWQIPKSVIKTVRRNASRIEIVSAERIMDELKKVMKLGKLDRAIRLMKLMGLLKYILPEVEAMQGVQQGKKYHAEGDVYKHTLNVLRHAPPTIEGQLGALLHDVGKPKTQEIVEGAISFHGHEEVGAEMAKAILYRLKFDAATIKKVVGMVRHHMRPHYLGPEVTDKAIRKFIRDLGDELVDATLDVSEADELGSIPQKHNVKQLRERIKRIKESPLPVSKKPVLDGREIMTALNVKPGRVVGEAGRFLLELADDYAAWA